MLSMKSGILALTFGFLPLSFGACKDGSSTEEESASVPEARNQSAEEENKKAELPAPAAPQQPKKTSPQLTCGQRGIPSWESAIADLVKARCEKCHSPKLAYKGILLTSYQELVQHQEKSLGRIQTNSLNEPLDPVEQQFFIDFFKAGLPEKETDCKDP